MKRRLTKSRTNVVLTGTLAGIAEYLGIDPTIVRIVYVFITMAAIGSPIMLYILLAIIIPTDHSSRPDRRYGNRRGNPRQKQRKEAEKVDEDDWSDF